MKSELHMKRYFDIIMSSALLISLWPLMILTALLVRYKLGSPVVFRQLRPGLNGKPFVMYKFRTLSDKKDRFGNLMPDSMRMTPLGNLLRKTSLDELPELINVLKGDMSLVGPRPLLMQYLERYNSYQALRHNVKPGITGWAQVNGRNALDWMKKFQLDVWYVQNQSFRLDIKILYLTIFQVFRCRGIHQEGQATAEEFMGNTDYEQ